MNKQLKQQMLLIFFGVALFAALTNLNEVASFFRVFAGGLGPFARVRAERSDAWYCAAAHGPFPEDEGKNGRCTEPDTDDALCRSAGIPAVRAGDPTAGRVGPEHRRTRKGELARLGGAAEQLRRRHHGADKACGLV